MLLKTSVNSFLYCVFYKNICWRIRIGEPISKSPVHYRGYMLRHTKPITRLSRAYKNQTTEM